MTYQGRDTKDIITGDRRKVVLLYDEVVGFLLSYYIYCILLVYSNINLILSQHTDLLVKPSS